MLVDVTEYVPANMKPEDKRVFDELENVKEAVLNSSVIDDYLNEECQCGTLSGRLLREVLEPFVKYLRCNIDCRMMDFCMDCIDGYDDEELAALKAKKERGIE